MKNKVEKSNKHTDPQTERPFFDPAAIQPKLTIGQPDDEYEREADAMADRIAEAGNIYPSISIEGDPALTDQRRGEGAYKKVTAAMRRLATIIWHMVKYQQPYKIGQMMKPAERPPMREIIGDRADWALTGADGRKHRAAGEEAPRAVCNNHG